MMRAVRPSAMGAVRPSAAHRMARDEGDGRARAALAVLLAVAGVAGSLWRPVTSTRTHTVRDLSDPEPSGWIRVMLRTHPSIVRP